MVFKISKSAFLAGGIIIIVVSCLRNELPIGDLLKDYIPDYIDEDCGDLRLQAYDYSKIAQQPTDDYINELPIEYNKKDNTDDPLAYYQWNLSNRGQKFVNNSLVSTGNDINVGAVHNQATGKIRGRGIVVNIADSGLEMRHEDLRTDLENSYNFIANNNDPTPHIYTTYGPNCVDHGTEVGGIVAAKSGNGVGIVGVAPAATLIGFNILSWFNYGNFETAMGTPGVNSPNGATKSDIINMSFGFDDIGESRPMSFLYSNILKEGVLSGRQGKGYIYIKAAGNGFLFADSNRPEKCDLARIFKVSCQNSNYAGFFIDPYHIKTSASDSNGKLTSYSTIGSSIFVNAPAGEYSVDSGSRNLIGVAPEIQEVADHPATLTVDLMGCVRGQSLQPTHLTVNDFEYSFLQSGVKESHRLNKGCNYTSTFNGTSAATPVVSGVVALMLEVNPNLSWRQVKYILAHTSDNQIDSSHNGAYINYRDATTGYVIEKSTAADADAYQIDQGWITNAAGLKFSNYYGFGRVDAQEAVALAQSLASSGNVHRSLINTGENVISGEIVLGNSMIFNSRLFSHSSGHAEIEKLNMVPPPDFNSGAGLNYFHTASYDYNGSMSEVDAVTVVVNVQTQDAGKILIRLTSPQNTKSIVFHPFSSLVGSQNLYYSGFLSNAFFGEDPLGKWQLEVFDLDTDVNKISTIDYAGIVIYGN